jgi:nucleotide-binding universal stress UspA family protein
MAGIVVGVDGSADAQVALEWAVAEAERRNAPLTVITVVPLVAVHGQPRAPILKPADDETLKAAATATTVAVEKATAGREISVSVRAATGAPAEILLKASADADLLVVGSRGRGGFARLLLGSVSSQVVHHTNCPTVVVPSRPRS